MLDPCFAQMPPAVKNGKGCAAPVIRCSYLIPTMQEFIQKVRIYEGFLSEAQVTDASNLVPGTPNFIAHMIAKANEEHSISSQRLSRCAAWMFMLKSLYEVGKIEGPSATQQTVYDKPEQYQPASLSKEYQALGIIREGLPHVVVVEEAYRGAVVAPTRAKVRQSLSPC